MCFFCYTFSAIFPIYKKEKCLNFITFEYEGGRKVDQDRFKTGNVSKLALYGQGNCHGCTSLIMCFLYPFRNILGIDIKYRGGGMGGGYDGELVESH